MVRSAVLELRISAQELRVVQLPRGQTLVWSRHWHEMPEGGVVARWIDSKRFEDIAPTLEEGVVAAIRQDMANPERLRLLTGLLFVGSVHPHVVSLLRYALAGFIAHDEVESGTLKETDWDRRITRLLERSRR